MLAACGSTAVRKPVATVSQHNQVVPAALLQGSSVGDWPMFGYDPGHTGYVDALVQPHMLTGSLAWTRKLAPIFSSAVAGLGMVYIASTDGYLYALSQSSGAIAWRAEVGNYLTDSTPALEGKTLFVATHGTRIEALNALTGASYWTFAITERIEAPPLVVGGRVLVTSRTVYVATWHGEIFALDRVHGDILWVYTLNGKTKQLLVDGVGGSMALAGGQLFVGDYRGELICLDGQHGHLLWRFATGAQVLATPVVTAGLVYIGSDDGNFYALDVHTGRPAWRYATGEVRSAASLAGGHLFVGSLNGAMYAFS